MRRVLAVGSWLNWDFSEADCSPSGLKVHFMVLWLATSRPSRVVAAKVILWCERSGMRKVAVQPAPRMRKSTSCIVVLCYVRERLMSASES